MGIDPRRTVAALLLLGAAALAWPVSSCRNHHASGGRSLGPSGSRAGDYLSAAGYTRLLVEVDYIQGRAPRQAALDLLAQRLGERCTKPGGVTVQVGDEVPDQGRTTWTLGAIRTLESQYRNHYTGGDQAVLYYLYLDGGSEWDSGNAKVLGVAHTGSSIAIFKDSLDDSATGLITGSAIERAVLVHEAGHQLGLVDNGIPMVTPHADAQHPAHDSNSACVMYWAVESSLVSQVLSNVPDDFDVPCMQDTQAAGGQ